MITIRYPFEAGEFVATLYLDGEPIETRTFGYRRPAQPLGSIRRLHHHREGARTRRVTPPPRSGLLPAMSFITTYTPRRILTRHGRRGGIAPK